jgi:hypothetical protein
LSGTPQVATPNKRICVHLWRPAVVDSIPTRLQASIHRRPGFGYSVGITAPFVAALVNPGTRRSVRVEWTDAALTVRDVYLAVSLNDFQGAPPGIKRELWKRSFTCYALILVLVIDER